MSDSILRLNRFKEVHYPKQKARREFKTLVQHYDELTAQQARLKTKLKARLRMQATCGQFVDRIRSTSRILDGNEWDRM